MERNVELAVVTGANRGIGAETCRQLAERGYRVILTSRDLTKGQAAVAALRAAAARGVDIEARALDVADADSVAAFSACLKNDLGDGHHVTTLVNNAGVSLDGFDADVAARTLDVNFFGAARVTDALLPLVAPGGRIVMVSSGMGDLRAVSPTLRESFLATDLSRAALDELVHEFIAAVHRGDYRQRGWPSNAYSVSKVALNALVRVLAPKLRAAGILVNAACPGWTRTDMGGANAPRSLEVGANSIVWAATLPPDGPTGGFFRDGRPVGW